VIVVPPNDPAYADPAIVRRLESYLLECFPDNTVEVAWVVQPRIEAFTVACRGWDARSPRAEAQQNGMPN
jgi:hypothetical protein